MMRTVDTHSLSIVREFLQLNDEANKKSSELEILYRAMIITDLGMIFLGECRVREGQKPTQGCGIDFIVA